MTPERFVEFSSRQEDPWGHRPWDELVECFTMSTFQPYGPNAARFATTRGYTCEVERTKAGWKLTMLFEGC